MEPDYVVIGEITKPQGVNGELKVYPLTDWPERFAELTTVYLSFPKKESDKRVVSSILEKVERKKVLLEDVRLHSGGVYLKIQGVDSRSLAEALRGSIIEVPRDDAYKLPDNSYYIFQIVGLKVCLENGEVIGEVSDVLCTGGNDVYVVKNEKGQEFLIPAIKDIVREVDISGGRLVIRPIPGLLDEE